MGGTTPSLAAGERIGNYQITGLIGAGGMGVVYKALDLKLERTVALKFLPHDLSFDEKEKKRFLQEARSASALDHSNIGVIHGVEESADGRLYIVMAYYEGGTLTQRIIRGDLPPSQAVDIAIQVARGLAEAHARNIVHRDIKPSNIIITRQNQVKIVDFGLARVLTASATQSLTSTGTAAYMAPEQVMGKPLDPRTDLWALGVVLAETLTGRHPFQRDSVPAMMFAVVNQPPDHMDEVTPELQPIVFRALSKDAAHRYPSAKEFLSDLERVRAHIPTTPWDAPSTAPSGPVNHAAATRALPSKRMDEYVRHASTPSWGPAASAPRRWKRWLFIAPLVAATLAALFLVPAVRERARGFVFGSDEKHIAVLPFDNIGNSPANEALAQGLMDSLASKLSNLEVGQQSLWVVPASEIRRLKIADPTAALHQVGATLVVKGSIQREGQDVRLTVNLINTKTLRQIGSAALEDRAGDLAMLQDEAVSRLARLLHINVTADMLRNTGGSVTPAAYEEYLKALGYMQRYDKPGNLDSAIAVLTSAVKTDPRFALGFAQLGEAYRLRYLTEANPKWIDEALANCQKAAQLDDRLPAVYVTLGRLHDNAGKHDLAVQEFQHALQLNARDADALSGIAHSYENAGRIQDAETTFQKASALRPDSWNGYNDLGLFYDRQHRYPESIAALRKAAELTPDNAQVYLNLGAVYIDSGDPKLAADAEQALKKSIELSPSYPAYANLGQLYYTEKRYTESAAMTEKALQLNGNNYLVWNNLAHAYQWLKEKEKEEAARATTLELAEKTAKLNPQDALAQAVLASLYARRNVRDKAIAQVQTALALSPDDPEVFDYVATAYESLGDRRRALDYVERALQKGYPLAQVTNDPDLQNLIHDPNFRPKAR
ncbi:MAG TPA: protein kinase [Terriglobales bacterium]|nr:protein kinase [Terriglobales bacterium]